MKGLAGNNLTPAAPKMTKPLKTEQVNKPKPGKHELFVNSRTKYISNGRKLWNERNGPIP
jgi:translation elongation factor P/translation initiation factor 5A